MAKSPQGEEWGRCTTCRRLSPLPVCVDCKSGVVVTFEVFWAEDFERRIAVRSYVVG